MGLLFNVQKFSINDGPGIRTTIFFKGCPLSCKWCANPESQKPGFQLLWDKDLCIGCGSCLKSCWPKALSWQEGCLSLAGNLCNGCGKCMEVCPKIALKIAGKYWDVEEVVEECMQDWEFYEESGGGVTLSGGEVLNQAKEIIPLLQALRQRGIHCAIETTGYTTKEVWQEVVKEVDLVLIDLKHYDRKMHLWGTGVDNVLTLANLRYLVESHRDYLVRIPIIPHYNLGVKEAKNFVELFKDLGIKKVELLPFHQYGAKKYTLLNKEYFYEGVPSLHQGDLDEMVAIFKAAGIEVIGR